MSVYECAICQKSYSYKRSLVRHQKICGHENPPKERKTLWKCVTCGKEYTDKSNMYRHKRIHLCKHVCPICSKVMDRPIRPKHHKCQHSKNNSELLESDSSDSDSSPSMPYPFAWSPSSQPDKLLASKISPNDMSSEFSFFLSDSDTSDSASSQSTSHTIPHSKSGSLESTLPKYTAKNAVLDLAPRVKRKNQGDIKRDIEMGITSPFLYPEHLKVVSDLVDSISGDSKGRGVVTTSTIWRETFVCSYDGQHISEAEGLKREKEREESNTLPGDYIFFFNDICIDATEDNKTLGRLLNHSRKHPNCVAKSYILNGKHYIIIKSVSDIYGTQSKPIELTYDYGEKRKHILDLHKWIENS